MSKVKKNKAPLQSLHKAEVREASMDTETSHVEEGSLRQG
jgi:hypothetical protein